MSLHWGRILFFLALMPASAALTLWWVGWIDEAFLAMTVAWAITALAAVLWEAGT